MALNLIWILELIFEVDMIYVLIFLTEFDDICFVMHFGITSDG